MRQFQVNSYLFGGNAPYVEELYERYLDNPGSVPDKWRAYFDQMQLVPAADGSAEFARRGACADRRIVCAARQGGRLPAQGGADRSVSGAQAGPRAVDHRGLSLPRQPLGQPRPAAAPGAPGNSGARAGVLRPDRSRHGHRVLGVQHVLRPGTHDAARDRHRAAPDLLRQRRRRIHVHLRSGAKALDPAAPRVDPLDADVHGRAEAAHPRAPDRGRRAGALPAHQVRRPEALLARGRRDLHRLDGRS